jgi:hypothetical protein
MKSFVTVVRGLLFLQDHRETDRFFAPSGVQLAHSNSELFHYLRETFSSHLKSKIDNILTKTVTLRIVLNIDGVPVVSRSHTHPSHSQTSRLLTSSLSLGVPVSHVTQCIRGQNINSHILLGTMRRVRCLWSWTSASSTTFSDVVLDIVDIREAGHTGTPRGVGL